MSHGMSEEIKRLHRLLDRKDSGADEPIITNEKVIADLRDELDSALDLLDEMFAAYENGPPCYEDPDEVSGFLGNAIRLDDRTFHKIVTLLNSHRPQGKGTP